MPAGKTAIIKFAHVYVAGNSGFYLGVGAPTVRWVIFETFVGEVARSIPVGLVAMAGQTIRYQASGAVTTHVVLSGVELDGVAP